MQLRDDVYAEIIQALEAANERLNQLYLDGTSMGAVIAVQNLVRGSALNRLRAAKPRHCPRCGKQHAELWAGGSCNAPH